MQTNLKKLPELLSSADALVEAVLKNCKESDGWVFNSEKENVRISLKSIEGSPLVLSRGTGEVAASADAFRKQFDDLSTYKSWDPTLINVPKLLEEQRTDNGVYRITYTQYSSPNSWIVSNRDFCLFSVLRKQPDGSVVLAVRSADPHVDAPPVKGLVRGELQPCGWYVVPKDANSVSVHYCVNLDPKGSIPSWVSNWVAVNQPLNISHISKILTGKK